MKSKIIICLIVLILGSSLLTLHSQTVRPIRDDIGFCWNGADMDPLISYLSKETESLEVEQPGKLIGGISVHDDYLYAGKVYYPLFEKIKCKEVIIFGVTHATVRKEMNNPQDVLILEEFNNWQGPYGNVGISPLREMIKEKLSKEYYSVSNRAHELEHSIEALIPFLQYYNRDIIITPIMVTQMPFERMEEISKKLSTIILEYINQNKLEIGKDIFFLISNDANHYGEDFDNSPYGLDARAHKIATENDKRIIADNLNGEINVKKVRDLAAEILPDPNNGKTIPFWCGRYPVVFGLLTIDNVMNKIYNKTIQSELIKYSDTFTEKVMTLKNTGMGLTAPFSYKHWCGWFTLGLYLN